MERNLFTLFLALVYCVVGHAQQSCVDPNPSAHIILIPAGIPSLDGQVLPTGSIISLVFKSGDSLRCAGQITWQGKSVVLQAYGATAEGDPGYKVNEPLKFRIILPNGCSIEDDLITSKFEEIENNQNPGFQNLAINRIMQLDVVSPKFNFALPTIDSLTCLKKQIELNPQVDNIGTKFQWSAEGLGIISTQSKITVELGGVYQLKVSLGGCTKTQRIEIKDVRGSYKLNLTLAVNPVEKNVSCKGGSDGILNIQIKETGFNNLIYRWSDAGVGSRRTNLKAGSYKVILNSEAGCAQEFSATLTEPDSIKIEIKDIKADTSSKNTGAIEVTVNGGTPPYRYRWIREGQSFGTTQNLVKTSNGNYQLEVTDQNQCVRLSPIITIPRVVVSSSTEHPWAAQIKVFPNPTNGVINLAFDLPQSIEVFPEVLNTIGVTVLKLSPRQMLKGNIQTDLKGIGAGIYFVKIVFSGGMVVKKVLLVQ